MPKTIVPSLVSQLCTLPILPPNEQLKLVRQAKRGNKISLDKIIRHSTRMVLSIALRWKNNGIEIDDLISVGYEGLQIAINKFSFKYKNNFNTYAIWWVKAQISRYVILNMRPYKVLDHKMTNIFMNTKLAEIYAPDKYKELQARLRQPRRLDAPVLGYEGEDTTLGDITPDTSKTNHDELYIAKDLHNKSTIVIEDAMQILSNKEQIYIKERILAEDPCTLQDLGNTYGMSRERWRQIGDSAMRKLKKNLRTNKYKGFADEFKISA